MVVFPQGSVYCSCHTSTTSCEISLSQQSTIHSSHNTTNTSLTFMGWCNPRISAWYQLTVWLWHMRGKTSSAQSFLWRAGSSPQQQWGHQRAPGPPPGAVRRNCWGRYQVVARTDRKKSIRTLNDIWPIIRREERILGQRKLLAPLGKKSGPTSPRLQKTLNNQLKHLVCWPTPGDKIWY